MPTLFYSLFLLQVPTDLAEASQYPFAWISLVLVIAIGVLARWTMSLVKDKATEISALNTTHRAEMTALVDSHKEDLEKLNKALRELQSDYSIQLLEYTQIMHTAVKEVAGIYPDIKEVLQKVEVSVKAHIETSVDKVISAFKETAK